jgi:hypothetical protein
VALTAGENEAMTIDARSARFQIILIVEDPAGWIGFKELSKIPVAEK